MTETYLRNITADYITGVVSACEGIRDSLVLINGPLGCVVYHGYASSHAVVKSSELWRMRGALQLRDAMNDQLLRSQFFAGTPKNPGTNLRYEDFIFGTREQLRRALNDMFAERRYSLFTVIQAPGTSLLGEALESYNAMRQAEGEALRRDLEAKADLILEKVRFVEARSPASVAEYREKLYAKMREVLASASVDEARILTEAAIFADKVAVDEETVRLRSHLDQLRGMLRASEPIGRKLDFLMQEINRETNTIGSKCSDLEIARTVVDVKAELEKIREQIQNIE